MPLISNALTSLALAKAFLGITDSSKDTLLENLIAYATSFIEKSCGGRRFLETDYTELYDSPNGNILFLKNYPIVSITSVKYRAGTHAAPIWNSYSVEDYLWYSKEGYIAFHFDFNDNSFDALTTNRFGKGYKDDQYIQVIYKAGYKIDWANYTDPTKHTLPYDLTMLCNEIVALKYNTRTAQGIQSESTEGQSVTYGSGAGALTESQKEVIANYSDFRLTI